MPNSESSDDGNMSDASDDPTPFLIPDFDTLTIHDYKTVSGFLSGVNEVKFCQLLTYILSDISFSF